MSGYYVEHMFTGYPRRCIRCGQYEGEGAKCDAVPIRWEARKRARRARKAALRTIRTGCPCHGKPQACATCYQAACAAAALVHTPHRGLFVGVDMATGALRFTTPIEGHVTT